MDLATLPELALDGIVEYLPFEDLMNFSQTSRSFAQFQPKFQEFTQSDFSIRGPSSGHWCPEKFFDVPIRAPGIKSVKVWFKWKDQGFGNRKGRLWLELHREGILIADGCEDHGGLAAHSWEDRVFEVINHDVVKKCVKGDVLRVMRNIGGGGGHRLDVRDFKMRIEFKKVNECRDKKNVAKDSNHCFCNIF